MPPKPSKGGRRGQQQPGLGQPLLSPEHGVSRPASPSGASASADASGAYSGDLSTVNYIDVEFELGKGDAENGWEPTETIQPFVKDLCEVSHQKLCDPTTQIHGSSRACVCFAAALRSAMTSRRSTGFSRPGRQTSHPSDLTGLQMSKLAMISDAFASLDSVRNQRENILMLVANLYR